MGCSGCEMWDVGHLPGRGMLIYKMPLENKLKNVVIKRNLVQDATKNNSCF